MSLLEKAKGAKPWLAGGVTVTSLLFYMIVEAKDDFKSRDAAIEVRFTREVARMARELCKIRFRLDAQAGVPNPGGCESEQ